jgi:hypothetical protein
VKTPAPITMAPTSMTATLKYVIESRSFIIGE